mgnify:CR=1 FL=1
MSNSVKIKSIVFNAIDEFNLSQEVDSRLEKNEDDQNNVEENSADNYEKIKQNI